MTFMYISVNKIYDSCMIMTLHMYFKLNIWVLKAQSKFCIYILARDVPDGDKISKLKYRARKWPRASYAFHNLPVVWCKQNGANYKFQKVPVYLLSKSELE